MCWFIESAEWSHQIISTSIHQISFYMKFFVSVTNRLTEFCRLPLSSLVEHCASRLPGLPPGTAETLPVFPGRLCLVPVVGRIGFHQSCQRTHPWRIRYPCCWSNRIVRTCWCWQTAFIAGGRTVALSGSYLHKSITEHKFFSLSATKWLSILLVLKLNMPRLYCFFFLLAAVPAFTKRFYGTVFTATGDLLPFHPLPSKGYIDS